MLWCQIGDALVDLEGVSVVLVSETVDGRFCVSIISKNGQVINVGNYARHEDAMKELDDLRQKLQKANPQAVLDH